MNNKQLHPVIGSGFIAKKFKKSSNFLRKNNIIVYAAGISNSLEKNRKNLNREISKFLEFYKKTNKRIVYISTYSINDSSRVKNKYVKNKILIEKIIRKKVANYLIIRLPEIVGQNKNPYTLSNFFYNKINNSEEFILYHNTKRNILDIDDAIKNCLKLIKLRKRKNEIVNLLSRKFYTPYQIVKIFEKVLKKKANFTMKKINNSNWHLKNNFYINTKKTYLMKTLKKHYA
tara:strand:+ start:635 stop:1327 length:693 start_codon:yes stop_codon:yes gene_type:complete